jgi:uncharacterized protein
MSNESHDRRLHHSLKDNAFPKKEYLSPGILFNAHLETIYPSLMRSIALQPYLRERINTDDDDFLDLDWLTQQSKKLVIISHGLEGNTQRAYIKGMAKTFFGNGFDTLAWNFRGCGEEMNKQLRFYHSGATDDLDRIVQHAIHKKQYEAIYLVGFSLGGNLTLKYLGERKPDPCIKKSTVFSVPLNLHSSCIQISKPSNWIYSNRFLKSLKNKVIQKASVMQGINLNGIEKINSLIQFDDHFTAPIHGYRDAIDYYKQCSSLYFLKDISIPTLIVNAQNDPFLSGDCYPVDQLKDHPFVTFETPRRGGHVGFTQFNKNGLYWSEERALHFICS